MGLSRIAKTLRRRVTLMWRERPTQHDIEALQDNIRRVGLVIRVRWALVVALAMFSVLAAWAYAAVDPVGELLRNMAIPAAALGFVLLYNTYFQRTYRRLGNLTFFNHAQLFLDVAVVTVLVYFSGAVYSWFQAMYLLFVLEAAFILPRRRDVWLVAVVSAVAYGSVLWLDYLGVIPHVSVPFVDGSLGRNVTYVAVRHLWQMTVTFGTATVATLMMRAVRAHEEELAACAVVDATTGLFNRAYCHRTLEAEVDRARVEARGLSVVMVDVDGFMQFNRLFGIDEGDRMLKRVGAEVEIAAREAGLAAGKAATVCRFGGEEFIAILPGSDGAGSRPAGDTAETIRRAIEGIRLSEGSVTASVGVAIFPDHGATPDDLLASADAALFAAKQAGGNRVAVAGADPTPDDGA